MASEPCLVLVEKRGAVIVLTMNAPEAKNPVTPELRNAAIVALNAAYADPECRAIVLTGAGGAFSSGGDIRQMSASTEVNPMGSRARTQGHHELITRMISGPKPIVAAVEGPAFGAGLSLAAAADYVVASREAKFCAAFARIGVIGDCGLLWTLPQRIGGGAARDMLFSARVVRADEARALGLADALSEPGSAVADAVAKAETYAAVAPQSIAVMRSILARAPLSLSDVLAAEADVIPSLLLTADHSEAKKAFLEKRTPNFIGK